MQVVRKLRHWKQRYDPHASFICRRRLQWGGLKYEPGDPTPDGLAANKGKLRRFWEAGWIELAEFKAPNVVTGLPMETPVEDSERPQVERRGSWYVVTMPDGSERKALGRKGLNELLVEIGGCR